MIYHVSTYHKIKAIKSKVKVIQGGQSSSKNISIAQILIEKAIEKKRVITVMTDTYDNLKDGAIILNTAKALEIGTSKIFSEVIKEEITSTSINYSIAKLSGGTFAVDLVNDVPLGADIACENPSALKILQEIFHGTTLRIYGNTDLIGVEYAGAFKNVIAIFTGIINGLGLPYGSETHMISRKQRKLQLPWEQKHILFQWKVSAGETIYG